MQNRMRTLVLTAIGIGAVSTAAVATQAGSEVETFDLVEVAGSGLPALIEEEDGCREQILAGRLTLEADGDWSLVTRERETCGDQVEEEEEREEGTYEVQSEAVLFTDDDGDSGDADDGDDADPNGVDVDDLATGTRTAEGLEVRLEDGNILIFRR